VILFLCLYLDAYLGSFFFYLSTFYHLLYSRIHSINPSLSLSEYLVRSGCYISSIGVIVHQSSWFIIRISEFIYFIFSFRSGGSFDYFFSSISGWGSFIFIFISFGARGAFSKKSFLVHDIISWVKRMKAASSFDAA